MNQILLFVIGAGNTKIKNVLDGNYTVVRVNSTQEAIQEVSTNPPRMIITNYAGLSHEHMAFYNALRKDFIAIDIPVIALLEDDSVEIKRKLYTLNVKEFIACEKGKEQVLAIIQEQFELWNPNIGSYTHRFVKSFLFYAESRAYELNMRNNLAYLFTIYKLSNQNRSDLRFASALLSTTFTMQNINHILDLCRNMRFAKGVIRLLENFQNPKELDEELLYSVYLLEKKLIESPSSTTLPDIGVNPALKQHLHESFIEKRRYVQSYKDVISYWEDISDLLFINGNFQDEAISEFLLLFNTLLENVFLNWRHAILQTIKHSGSLVIVIKPTNGSFESFAALVKSISIHAKDISVDAQSEPLSIVLKISNVLKIEESSYIQVDKPDSHENKLLVKTYEYGDTHKTAIEYVAALGDLNYLQDEFQAMDETEHTLMEKINRMNFLDHEECLTLIALLRDYKTQIQNNFYEFEAIILALHKLEVIGGHYIEHFPSVDTKRLKHLLDLIIVDIKQWKEHIFFLQDAKNIHYLDNSILSSAMQIEAMFSESEDEDENFELF